MKEFEHHYVTHSIGHYVDGETHTNNVENLWASFKRLFYGTYHQISYKPMHRCVNEVAGRLNMRDDEPLEKMEKIFRNMVGKRLPWKDLVA